MPLRGAMLVAALATVLTTTAAVPVAAAPAHDSGANKSGADVVTGHLGPAAPTPPPPVSAVTAYQDVSTVTLSWKLPATQSVNRILVSYAQGRQAPQRPSDGTPVAVSSPAAVTAQLPGLAPDTAYSASVWTRRHRKLSRRRTVHFTTLGALPSATAEVSGIVTDTDSHPLAGVQIFTTTDFSSPALSTVTGTDGSFDFQIPTGDQDIQFDGSSATGGDSDGTGYVPDEEYVFLRAAQHMTFSPSLAAGAAATGRVIDAAGSPVEGATVLPRPTGPYVEPDIGDVAVGFVYGDTGHVTTASDGTFRITGLSPGATRLCFGTDEAQTSDGSVVSSGCTDTSIAPAPGTTVSLPTTTLGDRADRIGALRGVVRDAADLGVSGADVEAMEIGPGSSFADTLTGTAGRYSFPALPPGRYQLCVDPAATDPNMPLGNPTTCFSRPVRVVAGASRSAVFQLPAAGAISGVVHAAAGGPVANAVVTVSNRRGGMSAMTGADGRYLVPSLPAGTYRVCFATALATSAAPGGVARKCYDSHPTVPVEDGKITLGIRSRLPSGGTIQGVVTNPNPTSLTFSDVSVHRMGGRGYRFLEPAPNGQYRSVGLQPGRYRVCADVLYLTTLNDIGERCETSVLVRAGAVHRGVNIQLRPFGSVDVSLTDASGDAVAGGDVATLQKCTDSDCDRVPAFNPQRRVNVSASWVTDADGTVILNGLPAGTYALCAFAYLAATAAGAPATGFADGCSGDTFSVTVAAGGSTPVSLVLADGGEVTGTVTNVSGTPLSGAHVHVSGSAAADVADLPGGSGKPPARRARTDAGGNFAVRSVAAGQQTVCFSAPGYRSQCFGGQPGGSTGTPVSVSADVVTAGIDIALSPKS